MAVYASNLREPMAKKKRSYADTTVPPMPASESDIMAALLRVSARRMRLLYNRVKTAGRSR